MEKQKKYLENQILKLYSDLEYLQDKVYTTKIYPDSFTEDDKNELEISHDFMIKSLHNHIICYLEVENLHRYLDIFIKEFGEFPDTEKAYANIEHDPSSAEIYNKYLHELWIFLTPFSFMRNERNLKTTAIHYLENILNNTATILYNLKITPKSEAEIYNHIKTVLMAIFPNSKQANGNFLKTAKEYKPDILIPELRVAIEYKFAQDETKLKNTIDQIAADVKGYTGDYDYDLFYAVFYVTEDFWGKIKFDKVWKENKFPKNWKAIYVVGNSSKVK